MENENDPLLNYMLNPRHFGWIMVQPETLKIGFYCEHTTPIYIRLSVHDEYIIFAHHTHTALCLCKLEGVRKLPGVLLELYVPPPYTLFSAQVAEEGFELFVLRRTTWEQGETPVAQDGYSRPPFLLGYGNDTFMLNHCPPTCINFV